METRPPVILDPLACKSQKGTCNGALARTAFTDQSHHLAGSNGKADVLDDERSIVECDVQTANRNTSHCSVFSVRPIARAIPSAKKLPPMDRTAIALIGARTARGWIVSELRLSLTMSPQSAFADGRRKAFRLYYRAK